jgi:hypothetical protein
LLAAANTTTPSSASASHRATSWHGDMQASKNGGRRRGRRRQRGRAGACASDLRKSAVRPLAVRRQSDIQVGDLQRVVLDEIATRLDHRPSGC